MDLSTVTRRFDPGDGSRVRVAVDAMGGDHAPEEVVRGCLAWAADHPEAEVLLVGDEARIRPFVDGPLPSQVSIVHAAEVVGMGEQPAAAVRRKRDASINVCMRLVREGRADAVVTAGHTGAAVAAAILYLGRLRGVDRPALAVQMLTGKGPFVLLDIGATTDSTGLNLAQYARMGTIYAEQVVGIAAPTVALLSIGEEEGKGEQRIAEATELLRASDLRFVGNVEGKDLPAHPADVVVCDATVGNVTIKFFEGLTSYIFDLLRTEFRRPPWGPLGYLFMRAAVGRIRERFDYERLGGAPLLGVKGTVLITHGRAKRRMIGYAVAVGAAAARARIPERIADALRPVEVVRAEAGAMAAAPRARP
ncbi:MAG TPA: phosphate acyltransferase PlsX [Candidatus Limnocylindrales bacterium]|jgi:glycerol-3-phosphate acyltransferase PlsX|nr:phosphate acyltransferase PlsX [Candidatus Limnocylindrales bacterium]